MFGPDELDDEVEKKLAEYEEKFPQGFPLMEFDGGKKQLIKVINKCIKGNKPYHIEYEDGWDY